MPKSIIGIIDSNLTVMLFRISIGKNVAEITHENFDIVPYNKQCFITYSEDDDIVDAL